MKWMLHTVHLGAWWDQWWYVEVCQAQLAHHTRKNDFDPRLGLRNHFSEDLSLTNVRVSSYITPSSHMHFMCIMHFKVQANRTWWLGYITYRYAYHLHTCISINTYINTHILTLIFTYMCMRNYRRAYVHT